MATGLIRRAVAVAVAGGCATTGFVVTGPGGTDTQSETALATSYSGQNVVVAAYNDETNSAATIQYTATTRKVLSGASQMGWSYSVDEGKTWTYGGKLAPPPGWAVLWGDPALTDSRGAYRYVFMSNLAIPDSKMPAGGINGSVIISGADSYIGGACIARSSNGGKTFAILQCVSNTEKNGVPNSEKGHFYDGGSMASSSAGEIYAAFVDVTTDRIDVWRSPSESGTFTPMPTPFPNMGIISHPRLRVSYYDNSLYVAAEASNHIVYINRYANGQWGAPVAATNSVELYPCVNLAPGSCGSVSSKTQLRTGPQFSFDIGASSVNDKGDERADAVRFLYTQRDAKTGRLYVTGSYCPLSLMPGCYSAPEWGTTPGNLNTPGDQFNPNVSAWRGFIGLPPVWKATYLDRSGSPPGTVSLHQGNLAYLPNGPRIYLPFEAIKDIPVCGDLRGYWGDYDDLVSVGFTEGGAATFLRTMSDSSAGCVKQWQYTSANLHVRAAVFQ